MVGAIVAHAFSGCLRMRRRQMDSSGLARCSEWAPGLPDPSSATAEQLRAALGLSTTRDTAMANGEAEAAQRNEDAHAERRAQEQQVRAAMNRRRLWCL